MQPDFDVVKVKNHLLENRVFATLDKEEEKPVFACQSVYVGVLAERLEVDLPHVKGLIFLLLFLEEVDMSVVDGPSCLVVLLHYGQCCPVVCLRITCVVCSADPDAARHLGLVVRLERSVHAVIEGCPSDLLVPGLHELRIPEEGHPVATRSSALRW
jgi:hypothetical protein